MKIERMNRGSWGKVRSFFDITTQEGFTIKGFKLIEGINGLFVSMPSQKGNDEEYYDTIWVDSKILREELNTLAINTYQNENSQTTAPPPEIETLNDSAPTETMVPGEDQAGQNLTEKNNLPEEETIKTQTTETPTKTAEKNTTFTEDDIPF